MFLFLNIPSLDATQPTEVDLAKFMAPRVTNSRHDPPLTGATSGSFSEASSFGSVAVLYSVANIGTWKWGVWFWWAHVFESWMSLNFVFDDYVCTLTDTLMTVILDWRIANDRAKDPELCMYFWNDYITDASMVFWLWLGFAMLCRCLSKFC